MTSGCWPWVHLRSWRRQQASACLRRLTCPPARLHAQHTPVKASALAYVMSLPCASVHRDQRCLMQEPWLLHPHKRKDLAPLPQTSQCTMFEIVSSGPPQAPAIVSWNAVHEPTVASKTHSRAPVLVHASSHLTLSAMLATAPKRAEVHIPPFSSTRTKPPKSAFADPQPASQICGGNTSEAAIRVEP